MIRRPHRILYAAAALALLWAAPALAKAKAPPDYFPLRLHDWWKYRSTQANGNTSEFTLSVVSEEKQPDGTVRRCVELTNPNPLIRDWYTKAPGDVLLHDEEYLGGGGKAAFEPPRLLLQLPLHPGSTWRWSGTGRAGVRIEESSEVFPSERIVDAGRPLRCREGRDAHRARRRPRHEDVVVRPGHRSRASGDGLERRHVHDRSHRLQFPAQEVSHAGPAPLRRIARERRHRSREARGRLRARRARGARGPAAVGAGRGSTSWPHRRHAQLRQRDP